MADSERQSMDVTFWGVRGSIAAPGPETSRYGGNTSCVEVRTASGTRLVLDAGTGIRALGLRLADAQDHRDLWLFLGHTHWDHIQGLPFFRPAYSTGQRIRVHGPRWPGRPLAEVLAASMEPHFFPVGLGELGADVAFRELGAGDVVDVGEGVTVRAARLNHPAATLAYRVEADGAVFVYATDTAPFRPPLLVPKELWEGGEGDGAAAWEEGLLGLMRGADLVAFDTMFTAEEYPRFPTWGHATADHAVELCARAGARRLALYHHAPHRTDRQLDAELGRARRLDARVDVDAAAEGETHRLVGAPGAGAGGEAGARPPSGGGGASR